MEKSRAGIITGNKYSSTGIVDGFSSKCTFDEYTNTNLGACIQGCKNFKT